MFNFNIFPEITKIYVFWDLSKYIYVYKIDKKSTNKNMYLIATLDVTLYYDKNSVCPCIKTGTDTLFKVNKYLSVPKEVKMDNKKKYKYKINRITYL